MQWSNRKLILFHRKGSTGLKDFPKVRPFGLSEKSPHYNAKEETMALEDIFLYYFGEKTGDDYDVL